MSEGETYDHAVASEERFFSGHTGRMFWVLALGLGAVKVSRRMLPPLLPVFIADLSITPFEAGIVLSIVTGLKALTQYPSGRVADRLTRKTALVTSLGAAIVGAAVLAATPTYAVLLLAAAVIGTGEGLYGPSSRALLSDLFREKRGRAFGIFTMLSDIGGIAAAGLVTGAVALAVWRVAPLPVVVVLAGLLALMIRWGREPVTVDRIEVGVRDTLGRLFGRSRFRWLVLGYTLFSFTSRGVVGFLPTLLQAHHDFPSGLANAMFALLFVVGLGSRPVAGWLSDRVPRLFIGGGGLLLAAVGIGAIVFGEAVPSIVAGVVVFALGQKAFPPSVQAYLMDLFPDSNMGGDLGATRTVYMGLGGIGPAYVGFAVSRWGYPAAFAGFILPLAAAGAILLVLSRND